MLKIIKKICKSWENCKVTNKMADEILIAIENVGMLPPIESDRTIYDLDLGMPKWELE